MLENTSGGTPLDPATASGRPSRRQVLRWMGIAGAATAVPIGLAACEPATPPQPQPLTPDPSMRGLGFIGGTDTVLGTGAWCWFQSPRTSFGPNGVLWLGSSVGTSAPDKGAVQATAFDIKARKVILKRTLTTTQVDDHTSPSVLALGDKVQISWALHQRVNYLDIADGSTNGSLVSRRIKRPGALTAPGRGMAYSSAHIVKGVRWILYRGEEFSWNLLTSLDGVTWQYRGLVIKPAYSGARPYVVAVSDGDRLHLTVTDNNPTEYRGTSVYAGTLEWDLTMKRSDGTVVGSVGAKAPMPKKFTRLVEGIPGFSEALDDDFWQCDLRFIDNHPTGVLSHRDNWPADGDREDDDGPTSVGSYRHRYLWIRQRPTGWIVEPLCWGGSELCSTQPDYSGLVAQDPSDATRVVVSTNVHPVTGKALVSEADGRVHWELFQGKRVGEGSWQFTALTQDSVLDNLRPSIAAGGPYKALSWMRGTYRGWRDFDTEIVVRRAVAPPVTPAPSSTSSPAVASSAAAPAATSSARGPVEVPKGPDPTSDDAVYPS
ncbi:hypothetical protein [Aquihabitans sp. McL0605]|uniref:hypothetical protein n=1 Tax=Aquihabitans sp. McL0605 TaxID=3415671 RepID=UPI003CEC47AC